MSHTNGFFCYPATQWLTIRHSGHIDCFVKNDFIYFLIISINSFVCFQNMQSIDRNSFKNCIKLNFKLAKYSTRSNFLLRNSQNLLFFNEIHEINMFQKIGEYNNEMNSTKLNRLHNSKYQYRKTERPTTIIITNWNTIHRRHIIHIEAIERQSKK